MAIPNNFVEMAKRREVKSINQYSEEDREVIIALDEDLKSGYPEWTLEDTIVVFEKARERPRRERIAQGN